MTLEAIAEVRAILECYTFRANSESDLQAQVAAVLETCVHLRVSREVVVGRGRYDILVVFDSGTRLVLELKVAGTAEAAERQAQRYARDEGVDAVAVVTSSQRIARQLMAPGDVGQAPAPELGRKPFGVISLRAL